CPPCPVSVSDARGPKMYGCLKLASPPFSSDEYAPFNCIVRAPPKKLTWRQSAETRPCSSEPSPTPKLILRAFDSVTVTLTGTVSGCSPSFTSASTLTKLNVSRPYSRRWLSCSCDRRKRQFGRNVSWRVTTLSL